MNDNPTPSPLPPWSDIQSNIATNGMPAYLSALKTVKPQAVAAAQRPPRQHPGKRSDPHARRH